MSSILRPLSRSSSYIIRATKQSGQIRSFHSPYVVLGKSPLTAPPAANSNASSAYEKQSDYLSEPQLSHSGNRTYVVSEPDSSSKYYQVPSGAYPTSAPYVNFTATEAPDTKGAQVSSTSADMLSHTVTTRAAMQHHNGVGESAAIRNTSAPGEMGARGGGYGGVGMMDKAGTTSGEGELAERNPPPDGAVAENYSKAGVDNAWKLRK